MQDGYEDSTRGSRESSGALLLLINIPGIMPRHRIHTEGRKVRLG